MDNVKPILKQTTTERSKAYKSDFKHIDVDCYYGKQILPPSHPDFSEKDLIALSKFYNKGMK